MLTRPLAPGERPWLSEHLRLAWGSPELVSRGRVHDAGALPAIVSVEGEEIVGVATYRIENGECELVTLDALRERRGIGTALLESVAEHARRDGCARVWLVTSNDNLRALRFYQRRGMRLVAVHRGAVDDGRRLKPAIPLVGYDGIPIHDEIELELALEAG